MSIPWTKPEIFGIKWDNGPNKAASPLTEISRDEFLRLFHCGTWGLDGLNYGGWCPLPDSTVMYTWQYYFFHRHALAIAHRYMNSLRHHGKPPTGHFIKAGDNGYDTHYYRLGCLHPNIKVGWVRMHDRQDTCPDCGFKAQYDTSG